MFVKPIIALRFEVAASKLESSHRPNSSTVPQNGHLWNPNLNAEAKTSGNVIFLLRRYSLPLSILRDNNSAETLTLRSVAVLVIVIEDSRLLLTN